MSKRNERGQALIAVIAGISLVLLTLEAGIIVVQFSGKLLQRQLTEQGQAINAAQAGLTEGVSWFGRQQAQPVKTFLPALTPAGIPPVNDTDEPYVAGSPATGVGLVRSYPISDPGRVWGRYELQASNFVSPTGTNTIDISTQRGKRCPSPPCSLGLVWQLESQGIVYVRNNPALAYNVSPNVVLSRRTLRTEIQRLGMNRPLDAALIVNRGSAINIANTSVEIKGNKGFGIAWVAATGTPTGTGYTSATLPPNLQITGGAGGATSGNIVAVPNPFTIPYIFGMTVQELRAMADYEKTQVALPGGLPFTTTNGYTSLPSMKLFLLYDPTNLAKNYVFDSTSPLNGTGILVVFGSLTIALNSNSTFNGMVVVVNGSYSQSAPSTVNGTVIVDTGAAGTVQIQGSGDKAYIRFDPNLLSFMASRMGLYRVTRSPYQP
jgi:hypothetical protein